MKKYSVLIMALLLVFAVAVSGSMVLAQDSSDFGGVMQRISKLEGLTNQEKEEIIVRSIELRYEDGLEVYQISGVLDEYNDYDGIMGQFDEIENNDSDDDNLIEEAEDALFGEDGLFDEDEDGLFD